jgi:hypothetical protein
LEMQKKEFDGMVAGIPWIYFSVNFFFHIWFSSFVPNIAQYLPNILFPGADLTQNTHVLRKDSAFLPVRSLLAVVKMISKSAVQFLDVLLINIYYLLLNYKTKLWILSWSVLHF